MIEFCLGGLGWTPEAFWKANLYEVQCAAAGFAAKHGVKGKTGGRAANMSNEELKALTRDLMARYPDKPREAKPHG